SYFMPCTAPCSGSGKRNTASDFALNGFTKRWVTTAWAMASVTTTLTRVKVGEMATWRLVSGSIMPHTEPPRGARGIWADAAAPSAIRLTRILPIMDGLRLGLHTPPNKRHAKRMAMEERTRPFKVAQEIRGFRAPIGGAIKLRLDLSRQLPYSRKSIAPVH